MFDINKLKVPFVDAEPSTLKERKQILRQLMKFLEENEDELCDALKADLNKPRLEALICEVLAIKSEVLSTIANIDTWCREKRIPRTAMTFSDTVSVELQPFGRVLILGAWNYPLSLTLSPMVGALAAGNVVVLKPPDLSPNTEAIIARLLPKYIDETVCQVFTGDGQKTMKLLDEHRFDYIFYTGGENAARSILAQVAKYLTPVTLELGGKSPVYVDSSANLTITAKRLIWAKGLNAGQTCVAPDYVLCHRKILDNFIEECIVNIKSFYGENMEESASYSRIINDKHTERLIGLLNSTKGQKVFGGKTNKEKKFIELTIVTNIKPDDALMGEEIFGPILPVISVGSSEEAIEFVRARPKPLAAYVFTSDKEIQRTWKSRTTSGSIVFNECVLQLGVHNLPFGGVGNSGMGRYFGESTIATFSNPRSVLSKSTSEKINKKFRYPPYTLEKEKWGRWGLSMGDTACTIS